MMDCKRLQENLCGKTVNRMFVDKPLSQSKWQQLQQQQLFLNETLNSSSLSSAQLFSSLQPNDSHIISEVFMNQNFANPSVKNDNNQSWSDDHGYSQSATTNQWLANKSDQFSYTLPNSVFNSSGENKVSPIRQDSFKKRKADNSQKAKTSKEVDCRTKRIKGETEATESNNSDQNNENNRETSAETSKVTEAPPKPDYIHVRARRGQATDSHSLAERVRREKISERMKFLQELVPGCNRITGKAGMLDEIINYVQSLQKQVEFLSMKIATVNPSVDIDIDDLMSKEMYAICGGNFPGMGVSSELVNPTYIPCNQNQQQQLVGCCNLVSSAISPQMVDGTSIVASLSGQETFTDSFQLHGNSSIWETDLQSYYNMELQQGNRSFSTTSIQM